MESFNPNHAEENKEEDVPDIDEELKEDYYRNVSSSKRWEKGMTLNRIQSLLSAVDQNGFDCEDDGD